MKNVIEVCFLLMMVTLTSCELIGDIFSAGFYTALFMVFLVIAIIVYVMARLRRRK